MKFSDGFWLNQRGYEVSYATQPYEITTGKNFINVFATVQYMRNKGMTLGGPVLDITFSSQRENIIKVNITHYKGGLDNAPKYELFEDGGYTPEIVDTEEYIELVSGSTKVRISKTQWSVWYYYKDRKLTGGGWRAASCIKENKFRVSNRLNSMQDDTFWSYPQDGRDTFIREQLSLGVGECIYGFGEKFTTFVKNGQNIEVWNADGGTCSDQTYKSIPFYVSSSGYGVFVNSSDKVSFEVASDTVSKTSFTVPGEVLEYFIIGGENVADVLKGYTTLTGKPALPPAYSFGLWLTTSFTTDYNVETAVSFISGMAQRDIPLQVFHFDCFWMKEFQWCDFTWDKRGFPDPEAMLKRLKNKGLQTCVWINPYIAQRSHLFDEGMKNGYFIKNPDGSVFQADLWQPGMAIVDFTNPDACNWYASKLRVLCEMGVDSFKTDFGERIPTKAVYHNGAEPIAMHNYYTHLYNKCVFNVLKEYYGEGRACLFARSATAGGQQFPVHWGGDCSSEYTSMAETIRGGLSLCLSGFGFFSHDISGFESTAAPDVYKRWAAFGLLSTHSRLHGNSSYRVPWLFDEESVDVLRFFTKLKGRLMPYLFSEAVKTSQTGVPMMRAMVVDYSHDPACLFLDRQYMLGENLLVAPIMNEEGTSEFYLPEGIWTDIISDEKLEGGRYYNKKYDYMSLPCLAKPNSVIAFGVFEKDFEYDYLEGAEFVVYGLEVGKSVTCPVYDKAGKKVFELTAYNEIGELKYKNTETSAKFTVMFK